MDDYRIEPGWRDEADRADLRSRSVSPHTLAFSIAMHSILAGATIAVLLHLGASHSPQPKYIVARIVDGIPGTEENSAKAGPTTGAGQRRAASGTAVSELVRPRPATNRLRKIGSSMRARIDSAQIKAHKYERAERDAPPSLATRAIEMKPGEPAKPDPGAADAASEGIREPTFVTGSGIGKGGGGGTGDDRDAHVAYGSAPAPDYPLDARRMEEQGVVMLRVLVSTDGAARRVEIEHSSGFLLLDNAALETVRERWRFVPATRAGAATESWVMVPIRFALTQADADDR